MDDVVSHIIALHSPFPVSLVCMCDLWYQWVVRVWVTKKRADRQ